MWIISDRVCSSITSEKRMDDCRRLSETLSGLSSIVDATTKLPFSVYAHDLIFRENGTVGSLVKLNRKETQFCWLEGQNKLSIIKCLCTPLETNVTNFM